MPFNEQKIANALRTPLIRRPEPPKTPEPTYNALTSFNYPEQSGVEAPDQRNITRVELARMLMAATHEKDWTSITIIITRGETR